MNSNKLPWGQNVNETSIEAPWRFLAGLDYKHGRQIRRVMAMVAEHIGRKPNVTLQNRWQRLHRHQRVSVQRLLRETKGNYLLYDILVWFAGHLKGTSREAWDAMQMLRNKTTFYARYRKTYYQEYKKEKKEWKAFRGAGWNSEKDRDEDTEDEEMGEAGGSRRAPRKTLEDKRRRMATYEVQYIREDDFVNQQDVPTENEDSDDDDLDDDDTEEEVNIFKEVPKIQGRTRSGHLRNKEVWEELPANLPDTEQLLVTPKKRKLEGTIVANTGSFGEIHDMYDMGDDEMDFGDVSNEPSMKWLARYTTTPPKITSKKSVRFVDDLPEPKLWNEAPMGMKSVSRGKTQDLAVTPARQRPPKPGLKGGEMTDFRVDQSSLFTGSRIPVVKAPKSPTISSTPRPALKKQKNSPYGTANDLLSTPIPHKKKPDKPIKQEGLESRMSTMGLSGVPKKRPGGGRKRRADSLDSDYVD
ncbi:hypothetical protein BDZ45DRAFT_683707 [Acephala macrosclerotiorum]|nr:hypothetical protein BDZ45DRAFT_683707 [Acephala macrosclerotiorum]